MSAVKSRNHDRAQDISPRQMVALLEVCERTGASLGQALATGEFESAHTWNDHVRPYLKNGKLGSGTGVWQFQPTTFHRVVKLFGTQLLAATEADTSTGRRHMDLGEGPFPDAKVRSLIQETVNGKRDREDEELQLLRHNFAVLAFANHYLSIDSGAATPEEDYLYHFLGAGQARRVLGLARGEARDTLCVKPVEASALPLETKPEQPVIGGRSATMKADAAFRVVSPISAERALVHPTGLDAPPPASSELELETQSKLPTLDHAVDSMAAQTVLQAVPPMTTEPAVWFPVAPDLPPPVSSEWGLPANSPTVTGNLGMFYRDGRGQTQPYTWAEFMQNLASCVQADNQPALVRAKYGVGFELDGGDTPERAFDPEKVSDAAEFGHENGWTLLVPEALITGPLSRDEAEQYKRRLSELVSQRGDEPSDTLPPETLSALRHLRMLPASLEENSTTDPEVRKALHNFRKKVGKDEPDDPAQSNLLMPAERIALEIYDQRLARYAALQARQQASFGDAHDLKHIRKMPAELQRLAAPRIAALQTALAAHRLLAQPTKKSVWRDKKRKKHVEYKTLPFAGKADKATVAALNSFQFRNGLLKTEGILDSVTLEMLGLPPMGPEIFTPLPTP